MQLLLDLFSAAALTPSPVGDLIADRRSPNSRVTRGHLTYLPLDLNEFP
jgi:hypothetical protein